MKSRLERAAAAQICGLLIKLSPQRIAQWAEGLGSEVAELQDDREALYYAVSGLVGLLPKIVLEHLRIRAAPLFAGQNTASPQPARLLSNPQKVGVCCAVVSALLGAFYLLLTGAPVGYPVGNLIALVIGLAGLAVCRRLGARGLVSPGIATFLMAAAVLLTAFLGKPAEGVSRWIAFGPVAFQTALLVLPATLVLFARSRQRLSSIGMAALALALAIQPDQAMACALFIGLAVIVLHQYDRRAGIALCLACIAMFAAMATPDRLSPAPFVDGVYADALSGGPITTLLVIAGIIALLGPALCLFEARGRERTALLAFLAVWSVIMLAAAVGNFPAPFVGYGSSAIIGYLLSLTALPAAAKRASGTDAENAGAQDPGRPGSLRRSQVLSVLGLALFGLSSAASQEAPDDCARTPVEKVEVPNTVWQPGPGGKQIPLWPDDVDLQLPDYGGNPEMTGTGSPLIAGRTWGWATYISRPTMTVYPPIGENSGAAMLVLPGGGYAAVAMDLEGTEICDWITQHGVTCIILKYRTPQVWRPGENGVGIPPDDLFALEDAQRAMSLLRDRAASYNIDPDEIGVIGFSAGAHIAAALSNAGDRSYEPVDVADEQPIRPDYAIVVYPGRFLAKRNPGTDLSLAPWVEVSAAAPPTLLIHAMNDSVNDVRHSIAYGLALHDMGVPVDMRFFARGCHAFGLRPTSDPVTTEWPTHAVQWLKHIGML